MKKLTSLLLIISLLFAFTACTKPGGEDVSALPETQAQQIEKTSDTGSGKDNGSNAIVVYFSRAGEQYGVGTVEKGNTKIIAEMIAEKTGAELFEIEPADSRYDLSYNDLTDLAKKEQSADARPEFKEGVNLSDYDTVYIGYPIWWGDLPMIVYSFLESNDFSGKTVYGFCTHAGSGSSGTARSIKNALPQSSVNDNILAIEGAAAQNEQDKALTAVEEWLEEVKS